MKNTANTLVATLEHVRVSVPHSAGRGGAGDNASGNTSGASGNTVILHDITMHIKRGEMLCLIGRSGCGKSTLLRAMMQLTPLSGGTLSIKGEAVIGFQEARLMPWLSVWRNIALGLKQHGQATPRAIAEGALEQVGLLEHSQAWPHELSGGQAQRVSLARAIVRKPDLLLLDEPFGALDSLTRADMQSLIMRLHQRQGFAMLMVTHDIAEAVRLADRVLVMREGRLAHDFAIDRSSLDQFQRPQAHAAYEDAIREALT